jgi:hypothetical protein
MGLPATIAVETETGDDPMTMLRLRDNDRVVGENLTAVRAHLFVGDVLERIALPNKVRVCGPRSH